MRSFGGRASILLTLVLAGVLAAKMVDAPPPVVKAAVEDTKPDLPEPKPKPNPQSVVLPAPPAPAAEEPIVAAAAPVVTPLQPTPPEPSQTAPTRPNIKPLPTTKIEVGVAHNIDASSIEPLRPAPRVAAPSLETPDKVTPQVRQRPVEVIRQTPAPTKSRPAKHPGAKAAATGRVLLRVLEHGEGPAIEIAWPQSAAERAALADHLRQCYGMRLALMDGAGALYTGKSPRGAPWTPNLDLYSGFVRRTSGRLPGIERRLAGDIRRRHGRTGATVHIFPRRVDALLLGGLQSLAGARYQSSSSIQAHYNLVGGELTVGNLRVDGQTVAGTINLSAAEHCRGGSA